MQLIASFLRRSKVGFVGEASPAQPKFYPSAAEGSGPGFED